MHAARHRGYPWCLLVLAAPSLVFLLVVVRQATGPFAFGIWESLPPVCEFLSRPAAIWSLAGLWVVTDVLIVLWLRHWHLMGRELHQPVGFFFLWQVFKVAYLVFYFAVAFAHHPYAPTSI